MKTVILVIDMLFILKCLINYSLTIGTMKLITKVFDLEFNLKMLTVVWIVTLLFKVLIIGG